MADAVQTPPKGKLVYGAIVETIGILVVMVPTLTGGTGTLVIEPFYAVLGGALFLVGQAMILAWVLAARRLQRGGGPGA